MDYRPKYKRQKYKVNRRKSRRLPRLVGRISLKKQRHKPKEKILINLITSR